MLKFSADKPKTIFYKIFIPFILSILFIIFISSYVLYFNFRSLALDIIYKENSKNLKNISLNAQTMQEIISSLSLQCYFDKTINNVSFPHKALWKIGVSDTNTYRYVRIIKTNTLLDLAEFRVYGY